MRRLLFILFAITTFGVGCKETNEDPVTIDDSDRAASLMEENCEFGVAAAVLPPAIWFNRNQRGVMTPFGRIASGTARELSDERLQYELEDGQRFSVHYKWSGAGYRYSDVRRERLPE